MICLECNYREAKGDNCLCDPCRLKQWRRDNPEKVKAYYEMRKVRDAKKIKDYQKIAGNNYYFGGNRIKVLERDNYTCQTCGARKSEGKLIVVHHKDRTGWGKKKEDKNNNMNNLISLCVPCHLAVHNPHRARKRIGNFKTETVHNTNNLGGGQ